MSRPPSPPIPDLAAPPARRYLALDFPLWPTDCLRRAEPDLFAAGRPVVLYRQSANAMRLAAADRVALSRGLVPGMALADARALCPDAVSRPFDPAATRTAFERLADAHGYVSPLVAVAPWRAPFGDLVIDITGVAHLWGGEAFLLEAVLARLARNAVFARGAIAPTLGAAWALARHAPGTRLETAATIADALAPLPVGALRLAAATADGLRQLGLKTVGQLYGRHRGALAARFSREITERLDQALGRLEERLVPRLPVPDITAERRFAEPLSRLDDIESVIGDLAATLCARLEREGEGAQAFHLFLFRLDHQVMPLSLNAAGATRDAGHVARLFSNRLETLREDFDAGFGIDIIRLGASSRSRLDPAQTSALAEAHGTHDLERLYDRLSSRLGPLAVTRARLENSHLPERAVRLEPVLAASSPAPLPPHARPARPLRLLPAPEPVEVLAEVPQGPPLRMTWRRRAHIFARASGPERIANEWWRPGEGDLTRDYYVAEDGEGRRFWLFREGLYAETGAPRWFVHGVFP